jgi:hypothetical protein
MTMEVSLFTQTNKFLPMSGVVNYNNLGRMFYRHCCEAGFTGQERDRLKIKPCGWKILKLTLPSGSRSEWSEY